MLLNNNNNNNEYLIIIVCYEQFLLNILQNYFLVRIYNLFYTCICFYIFLLLASIFRPAVM